MKLYLTGLGNSAIYQIGQNVNSKNNLYLATENGLLKIDLEQDRVTPIFEGISSSEVWDIAITPENHIFIATNQGLFSDLPMKSENLNRSEKSSSANAIFENEPTIHEVQEIALRYNSVHPEKVEKWRKSLKYRALFPTLSVDYDKTISTSSGRFYEGPNDWGLTLSWDLADLVWNDYEDDVDNRNRLTTQLRIDILDEVNRIYFERLRLKQEILIESEETSSAEIFIKKLRFDELTAALDAYTGGYFSLIAN